MTCTHSSQSTLLFTHLTICPTLRSEEMKGQSWCELCLALCTSICSRYKQVQTRMTSLHKRKKLENNWEPIDYQPFLPIDKQHFVIGTHCFNNENLWLILFYVAFCITLPLSCCTIGTYVLHNASKRALACISNDPQREPKVHTTHLIQSKNFSSILIHCFLLIERKQSSVV